MKLLNIIPTYETVNSLAIYGLPLFMQSRIVITQHSKTRGLHNFIHTPLCYERFGMVSKGFISSDGGIWAQELWLTADGLTQRLPTDYIIYVR